ncbi:MAG TPA: RNA-binding protein [Thermoanaerobaculia bacterium]|jgi:RNA recognition motif-containing protein
MKLHFGNLPKSVTEGELKNLVVPFADPTTLDLIRDQAGVSKGFAFLEFASETNGRAVIQGLDGKEVSGNTITVAEARPRKADARPRA